MELVSGSSQPAAWIHGSAQRGAIDSRMSLLRVCSERVRPI
jgi:hypothetical protein